MNTYISLTAYGDEAEQALSLVQKWIEDLEVLWSVTDENSDIYKIKHSEGGPVIVTDETTEIVSFTLEMAKETEGVLDPTIYPILITWGFTTHKHRVSDKKEIIQLLNLVNYQEVALSGNTICLNFGMMLDLDAVGKGYASDEVSEIL